MMNVENPLAYSFILQDDIYLLDADKQSLKKKEQPLPETVLVKETPESTLVKETPEPIFKYLGSYKKQYLIIAHYPDSDFMAETHLTALESTLKRLGYALDDTAI